MMTSPTCGVKRRSTCAMRGRSSGGTSPLSTPPIRRPWPPANTMPVISARAMDVSAEGPPRGANCTPSGGSAAATPQAWGSIMLRQKPFAAGEHEIALIRRATDHRHADFLRDLVSHLRETRARHEKRDAHLRRLDHHLGREAARRVENLVAAVDAIEPHATGDRVDRVVTTDILDEQQNLRMVGV